MWTSRLVVNFEPQLSGPNCMVLKRKPFVGVFTTDKQDRTYSVHHMRRNLPLFKKFWKRITGAADAAPKMHTYQFSDGFTIRTQYPLSKEEQMDYDRVLREFKPKLDQIAEQLGEKYG